ncbi:ATP-binding cassette domain-containing protein [Marinospirillum sp. MEB164]|uniref:ATP-binding cassette domain-containing protein n=1 Tax=Marinospirillum alkalitolerans TaxID=3123374 RepID=A0ABW8Q0J2_9GAMM
MMTPQPKPILRLEALSNPLWKPFSLTLRGGEICCVTGASGSGKSRFLRALADLEPHQGQVWLNEQSQQAMPAHLWRLKVRLVPAESQWWSDEVADHFPADVDPAALAALGLVQEAMHWQVSRLSSGEKQRLALLRALAFPLQVLLLDEPTAHLDPEQSLKVESWLKEEIQRHAWPVIWVAHDREQVNRVADKILLIQGEQIQEQPLGGH